MKEEYRLVDLTQTMTEDMPQWPDKYAYHQTIHATHHRDGVYLTSVDSTTGVGTHIDAPCHFCENGRDVSQLTIDELFCPAVNIDVCAKVAADHDYALTVRDIEAWVAQHGPIPAGALVHANTGWSARWSSPQDYCNMDAWEVMHFPGFSAEAATYLVEAAVAGIGIDTFSLDIGISTDFPVHKIMLGADKFQLENLAHLSQLPAAGAYVLAAPVKIARSPEAWARVVGFYPQSTQ